MTYKINHNKKSYTLYPRKHVIVTQGIDLPDINDTNITQATEEFYYLIMLALFKPQRQPSDARRQIDRSQAPTYKSAYQHFLEDPSMLEYAREALQFEAYNNNFKMTSSAIDPKDHDVETEMIATLPSLPKTDITFHDTLPDNVSDDGTVTTNLDDNDDVSKLIEAIPIPTERDLGLLEMNNLANAVLNTAEIGMNAYTTSANKMITFNLTANQYNDNVLESNGTQLEDMTGTSQFLQLPLPHPAKIEMLRSCLSPTPFYETSHLGEPDTSQLSDFCSISDISIALRLNFGQHAPFDVYGRALLRSIADDIVSADNTFYYHSSFNIPEQKQLIGLIGGDAGVGKSAVIKGLLLLAQKWKRRDIVETLAYTNIAACNIDGRTVHSARNISRNVDLQSSKMSYESKKQIANIRLTIVDEFSMFWLGLLGQLDSSTRSCSNPPMNEKPMGGKHIMLCGDLLQLPSTTNKPFYIEPTESATVSELHGWQLWQQVNYVAFLTENMRQRNDQEFQNLLVKLRWGVLNNNDIERINEVCFTSTPLPPPPSRSQHIQPYEFLSPVIVAKNNQRSAINRQAMMEIARSHKLPVYEILAEATAKVKTNQAKLNSLQYLNEDHSNFIPILFRFILYMPFMTTERLQLTKTTTATISKGTLGYIVGYSENTDTTFHDRVEDGVQIRRFASIPSYLLVKIRNSTEQFITSDINSSNNEWKAHFQDGMVALPASRLSIKIDLSNSNITTSKELKKAQIFNITAMQYPLVPMYACTVEKVQGSTIPDGITIGNLIRKGYKEQAVYVSFSRALMLSRIRLVQPLTPTYLQHFQPTVTIAQQMLKLLQQAHIPDQPDHLHKITQMQNWLQQRIQYAQNTIDSTNTSVTIKTQKPKTTKPPKLHLTEPIE
jgi:hypothetical protein